MIEHTVKTNVYLFQFIHFITTIIFFYELYPSSIKGIFKNL